MKKEIQNIVNYFEKIKTYPKIILDVGCYDCSDSIEFSKMWPDCKIYCFEASPVAIKLAKNNLIGTNNIQLIETIVSDVDGECDWYESYGTSFGSSSIKKPKRHLITHTKVKFKKESKLKCMKLDTWISNKNIKNIDLIWLDVNGGEKEFINGARETLKTTHLLFTEYFDNEMYENQQTLKQLDAILPDFEQHTTFGNNILYFNKLIRK